MKVSRSLLVAVLGSLLTASLFTGCSGGGGSSLAASNPTAGQTGTMRVLMTNSGSSRATSPLAATNTSLPLLFNQIQLVTGLGGSTPSLPDPSQDLDVSKLSGNLFSLVNTPQLVNLLQSGSTPGITSAVSEQVPAKLYQELRLVLDQSSAAAAADSGLPFSTSKLFDLIPITNGAQVNAGQTVLLLVDLAKQEAHVMSPSEIAQLPGDLAGINLP